MRQAYTVIKAQCLLPGSGNLHRILTLLGYVFAPLIAQAFAAVLYFLFR